jgi:uncharacterized protein (TIGR04255 family)
VTEVALTVQLEDAIGFRMLDLASIANAWADDLPDVSERRHLPRFYGHEDVEMPDTPRLWLRNDSGNRVLQLQQDRIAVNWAKADTGDEYPRYETIRAFLVDAWHRLEAIVDDLGLAMPLPHMCRLRYANELRASQGWRSESDTVDLIAPWKLAMSDDFLPVPAGLIMHLHIPDDRGSLDIHGWHSDEELFALVLESEVWPSAPDLDGVLKGMDLAHEWIVRGFTSATTPEAHSLWERSQ